MQIRRANSFCQPVPACREHLAEALGWNRQRRFGGSKSCTHSVLVVYKGLLMGIADVKQLSGLKCEASK